MNSIYSMYSIRYNKVIKELKNGYWDLKYLDLKNNRTLGVISCSTFYSKPTLYVDLLWALKGIPRLTVQHKFIDLPIDYNIENKMLLTAKRVIK